MRLLIILTVTLAAQAILVLIWAVRMAWWAAGVAIRTLRARHERWQQLNKMGEVVHVGAIHAPEPDHTAIDWEPVGPSAVDLARTLQRRVRTSHTRPR